MICDVVWPWKALKNRVQGTYIQISVEIYIFSILEYTMLTSNIIIQGTTLEDSFLKGTIFDSNKPSAFVYLEASKTVKPRRLREKGPRDDRWAKGLWTPIEQVAYINFLKERKPEMDISTLRRSQKIFIMMSKVVKTRSADQCRSHHQKIIKYHNTIEEAI